MKMYQVDAFASHIFEGNPAAVCPLDQWLDDALLQRIAQENNLSETAFFVPSAKGYALRWFTPVCEVDLCGHATLATAHVIFEILGDAKSRIVFETRSGDLFVKRCGNFLCMDFPASPATPCETTDLLVQALGLRPIEVLAGDDYMAVFDCEHTVRSIVPDQSLLAQLNLRGVIITAPGISVDFVSRFFAPKFGVSEDPVTGSAHCTLAPYWASRLGKQILSARQVSNRGGNIACELKGNRVILSGSAVTFMEADIFI
jgi:PhzF family phenazine biosynthesis protein